MIIPNIWKHKKCFKPPTSYGTTTPIPNPQNRFPTYVGVPPNRYWTFGLLSSHLQDFTQIHKSSVGKTITKHHQPVVVVPRETWLVPFETLAANVSTYQRRPWSHHVMSASPCAGSARQRLVHRPSPQDWYKIGLMNEVKPFRAWKRRKVRSQMP